MKNYAAILPRWLPALAMMLTIFIFSAQPGDNLPDLLSWDLVIKKSGHMLGYGMLALSYWHLLGYAPRKAPIAWLMAVGYALTDEFHQSFVPGRHAALFDVLVFDNLGALLVLGAFMKYGRRATERLDVREDRVG